jgi:hypothetical protein
MRLRLVRIIRMAAGIRGARRFTLLRRLCMSGRRVRRAADVRVAARRVRLSMAAEAGADPVVAAHQLRLSMAVVAVGADPVVAGVGEHLTAAAVVAIAVTGKTEFLKVLPSGLDSPPGVGAYFLCVDTSRHNIRYQQLALGTIHGRFTGVVRTVEM